MYALCQSGGYKDQVLLITTLVSLDDRIEVGDCIKVSDGTGATWKNDRLEMQGSITFVVKSEDEGVYPLSNREGEYSNGPQEGDTKTFEERKAEVIATGDVIIEDQVIASESADRVNAFYSHTVDAGIPSYLPVYYIDTTEQRIRAAQVIFDGTVYRYVEYSYGKNGEYNHTGEFKELTVINNTFTFVQEMNGMADFSLGKRQ